MNDHYIEVIILLDNLMSEATIFFSSHLGVSKIQLMSKIAWQLKSQSSSVINCLLYETKPSEIQKIKKSILENI